MAKEQDVGAIEKDVKEKQLAPEFKSNCFEQIWAPDFSFFHRSLKKVDEIHLYLIFSKSA